MSMVAQETLRDRLWLWGMKVNALQETDEYGSLGFGTSRLTVEEAIQQTEIRNVYMAGGLPISQETLEAMPSARRIVAKTALHGRRGLAVEECLERLLEAKALAAADPRVEGFLIDDFSTGSVDAGAKSEHLARIAFENALQPPHLPFYATIYTLSLERPGLADLLRYFDQLVVPLWHVSEIEMLPAAVERCAELSGNKPMLLTLYVYDFGNRRMLTGAQMQQQLEVVEPLVRQQRVTGLMFVGTCLFDLGWESVSCLQEWIHRLGNEPILSRAGSPS